MSERVIRCPGCQKRFRLRSSGGSKVRCPACERVIQIKAATQPAAPADDLFSRLMDEDDHDRGKSAAAPSGTYSLKDTGPPATEPAAAPRPAAPSGTHSLKRMKLPTEEPTPSAPAGSVSEQPVTKARRPRSRSLATSSSYGGEESYLASGLKLIVGLGAAVAAGATASSSIRPVSRPPPLLRRHHRRLPRRHLDRRRAPQRRRNQSHHSHRHRTTQHHSLTHLHRIVMAQRVR